MSARWLLPILLASACLPLARGEETRPAASDPATLPRQQLTASDGEARGATANSPADREIPSTTPDEPIGRALRAIGAPDGRLEDGPLWELIQRVQLEASGADVSIAALPDPDAVIAAGPVTVGDLMRLKDSDHAIAMVELTGAELEETLEHSALYFSARPYEFADRVPLTEPGVPGNQFDAAEGVSYEIDLTRTPEHRVVHLSFQGAPLAPDRRLKVAVSSDRLTGGGGYQALRLAPRLWRSSQTLGELLVDHVRRHPVMEGTFDRNWSLLPDYVSTPERPLIDRLVRQGAAPREEVLRLLPHEPARRGDLAYWLSRAFGWREARLSGAYPDVPDSLEPWLDGLLRRHVLGALESADRFDPFRTITLGSALDWCESAARVSGYALASRAGDASFRRGLLSGVDLGQGQGAFVWRDTLTRSQLLGLVANTRFPTIRVLGTTDFHGAMVSRSQEPGTGRPIGGSAVLAAWIARLRAENPEGTVLLDGGDWFQGTMISNLHFGRPVVEQMNALGYAAAAIGNHEFDWTADTLERRIHELQFAALGANLRERPTGRLPRWARSDTVVMRRGVRIGILGLCYPRTPSVTLPRYVRHLRFDDDSATAARIVPGLRRRERASVVIEVGHIPATSRSQGEVGGDLARLARGVPGVDLWLGGHSHNRVIGEVAGTPAMIAGSHGEVIAVCDLVVDPVRQRVIERRARLEVTYADAVEPDSATAARVAHWEADVAASAARPVGHNARRLTRNRGGESAIGNLVADAMREAVAADVALQNNGGLRADLPEGLVTHESIYEVMPFDNTIVTMELTGAELRRALEEGLRFERVTQVSGIHYRFDLGAPAMSRVIDLTLADRTPLDAARVYRVACNNFMSEGGDNYETLSSGGNKTDTGISVRDAIEDFIRMRSANRAALDYGLEGRAVRVPGSRPPDRGD